MQLTQGRKDFLVNCMAPTTLFFVSVLLSWLLSLAYPEGITSGETGTYYAGGRLPDPFRPNGSDWLRLPTFGAILYCLSKFPNPTSAVYWFNSGIFALNSSLVYLLGKRTFASAKIAFALAFTFILFEFVCMRMFFHHLHVTADPVQGEFVFLGALLALTACLYQRYFLLPLAYAVLGFGAFIKPVATAILPIWTVFAIAYWFYAGRHKPGLGRIILLSVVLLVAPVTIWSARNCYLYGQAKTTGYFGCALLVFTLPLLSDADPIFEDSQKNKEFISAVREREESVRAKQFIPKQPPFAVRMRRAEGYFINIPCGNGPFDYLAGLKEGSIEASIKERKKLRIDSVRMFQVDDAARAVAMRIIYLHPYAYLKQVFMEYFNLYTPADAPPGPWDNPRPDPKIALKVHLDEGINNCAYLYKQGSPDPTLSNLSVAKALASIYNNDCIKWVLKLYYDSEFWLTHLIFVVALASFILANKVSYPEGAILRRTAIVVIMLFSTAACQYFASASCAVSRLRYSLGSGELELHLLLLMAVFALIIWVRRYIEQMPGLFDWVKKGGGVPNS